ncbi:MAG: T9SS type A sorting domain-containing protein, partial [Saprospiraceae bacterium]
GGVDGAGNMLPEAGAAYIFERNADGTWMDKQEIVASNPEEFSIFGWSVGISGNHAVVGAYKKDQGSGTQYKTDAGAVYVFERDDSGTWNEVQELAAANNNGGDWLGYSVAISNDYIVAGAYQQDGDENGENSLPDAGAAYIFEKNPSGLWEEKQKLVAGDRGVEDQFAYAVSISGEFALIGARQEDEDFDENNPLTDAGSAYVFEKEGNAGAWNQVQKLTAADRSSGDWFGFSVAIDGGDALAGAFSDNRDAQGDNILNQAGSAYFFESSGTTLAGEISMDAKEISLSPNPAFSEVAIVAVEAMIKQVDIFDLNGRLVASKSGGSKSISINVHSLLSGIYILKIATDRKGILFKNLLKF